jgi:hypothetical protein
VFSALLVSNQVKQQNILCHQLKNDSRIFRKFGTDKKRTMKTTLLITSFLASASAFAQFTQANEPAIGSSQGFFLVDQTATDYAGVTGDGVTWDYRWAGAMMDGGMPSTTTMTISDPSSTPDGTSYPSATKAVEIEGFMTSYFASSATSRNGKGFTFDNNIITFDDSNDELLMNYPFAFGATLSDAFTGDADSDLGMIAITGTVTASVDGRGTLMLNDATTYTNVLRYKLVENASGNTFIGPITMTRTQYEYYNLTGSSLPVFVHSSVTISIAGSPTSQVYVMNSVQPDGFASVSEEALAGVAVYPNPATDEISVKGLDSDAALTLIDAQGKTVAASSVQPGAATMNVQSVEAGVYFLSIATAKGAKTERVVIR